MKYFIIATLSLFILSCNSKDYENIEGEWVCLHWIMESTGIDMCQGNVHFLFDADRTYTSQIGDLEQHGAYEIINDQLTCSPEGMMPIGVKINKLTADTLDFSMNRAGSAERMVLVRPST